MGAAREHGIIDAFAATGVQVLADNGYRTPAQGSTRPSDADDATSHRTTTN